MNLDDDQELGSLLREQATRHVAPDGLRAGLRAQAAMARAGSAGAAPARSQTAVPPSMRRFGWRGLSASFVMGVAGTLLLAPLLREAIERAPLEAELVAEHTRALQRGTLTAVVSTDRHTVKPWFQGRLDFAPPVFDLAAEGFPLQGGRVEALRGQPVAVLVYLRNKHVVELYIRPANGRVAQTSEVQRGFNLLRWGDGAMEYWAVSDVERGEMQRLAELWQARIRAETVAAPLRPPGPNGGNGGNGGS